MEIRTTRHSSYRQKDAYDSQHIDKMGKNHGFFSEIQYVDLKYRDFRQTLVHKRRNGTCT